MVLIFLFTLGAAGIGLWLASAIPSEKEIKSCMVTSFRKVKLCPTSNNYIPLSRISEILQKTVVMTEDGSFWTHSGFDFFELKESFEKNLKKGKMARGGSTITQQLAKNMFLNSQKKVSRKLKEAVITIRLEQVLTKREILEKYLNVVEFGEGLYGVGPASRYYFGTSPDKLSIMQSAFLAFLLPNPKGYSKSFHIKKLTPFADQRISQILALLKAHGKITDEQEQRALIDLDRFLQRPQKSIGDEGNFEEDTEASSAGSGEIEGSSEIEGREESAADGAIDKRTNSIEETPELDPQDK